MLIICCSIQVYWARTCLLKVSDCLSSARRCCISGPCACRASAVRAASASSPITTTPLFPDEFALFMVHLSVTVLALSLVIDRDAAYGLAAGIHSFGRESERLAIRGHHGSAGANDFATLGQFERERVGSAKRYGNGICSIRRHSSDWVRLVIEVGGVIILLTASVGVGAVDANFHASRRRFDDPR